MFLRTLNEAQGEAVGLGPRGEVVLTSEGAFGRGPTMTTLQCTILTRPEGGPSLRGTWRLLPSVATFSLRFTPPLAWKAPCREEPDVPADA